MQTGDFLAAFIAVFCARDNANGADYGARLNSAARVLGVSVPQVLRIVDVLAEWGLIDTMVINAPPKGRYELWFTRVMEGNRFKCYRVSVASRISRDSDEVDYEEFCIPRQMGTATDDPEIGSGGWTSIVERAVKRTADSGNLDEACLHIQLGARHTESAWLVPCAARDTAIIQSSAVEAGNRIEEVYAIRSYVPSVDTRNIRETDKAIAEGRGVFVSSSGSSSKVRPYCLLPANSAGERIALVVDEKGDSRAIDVGRDDLRVDPADMAGSQIVKPSSKIDYWSVGLWGDANECASCRGGYSFRIAAMGMRNVLKRAEAALRPRCEFGPGELKLEYDGEGKVEAVVYSTNRVVGLDEMKRFILSFGYNATVLKPRNLVEWHKASAKERRDRFAQLVDADAPNGV